MDGANFETKLAQWDNERWNETCRRMQVCLMAGSRRRAVRALDQFIGAKRLIRLEPDHHLWALEFFGADAVTLSILDDAGYTTIRSLMSETDHGLMQIESIGSARVEALRRAIKAAGC